MDVADPAIVIPAVRLHTADEQNFDPAVHHHRYSELEAAQKTGRSSRSPAVGRFLPASAVEADYQMVGPKDAADEVMQSEMMAMND